MTSLKEMIERATELKQKERLYSEEAAELSDILDKISLREKYLLRYINHPPFAVEKVTTAVNDLLPLPDTEVSKNLVLEVVTRMCRQFLINGQIFGKSDADDLETHLTAIVMKSWGK